MLWRHTATWLASRKCLLHIRVFFGGKTQRPCFDLSIHWLIKQITNTYRNHFSRSYENRSMLKKYQYSKILVTCRKLRVISPWLLYLRRGVLGVLINGGAKAPCKRTQHCWPTTSNIVGCYMLRPFAHPVACCCELLRKVWNRSNFSANNSQHFFCSVIAEA